MIKKISNAEFDVLSEGMETELTAVFRNIESEIAEYLDNVDESKTPEQIINEMDDIINGEVRYAKRKSE